MPNSLQKMIALSALGIATVLPERGGADEMRPHPLPTSAIGVAEQQPATLSIMLDFAKILTFERPARTIIIGNPGIADGTLSDENTMVITGKAIGTTNLIVLGEAGQQIANLAVDVLANTTRLTTVHNGEAQQVFSCTGPCRPLLPAVAK